MVCLHCYSRLCSLALPAQRGGTLVSSAQNSSLSAACDPGDVDCSDDGTACCAAGQICCYGI